MADEVKQEQQREPDGWKDIQLSPDLPLSALINFLNVLNQRLVAVEGIVSVKMEDGSEINLTDLYKRQAEAEKAEMAKRAAEQAQNPEK